MLSSTKIYALPRYEKISLTQFVIKDILEQTLVQLLAF